MKWYQLSSTKVIEQTKTKQTGLSSEERQQRLQTNGPNKIEEKQQLKTWQKLAKHFTDLLMVVLLAAAILKICHRRSGRRKYHFSSGACQWLCRLLARA